MGERVWHLADAGERRRAFLSASETCARRTGPSQDARIDAVERSLDVERLAPQERLMLDWDQVRELRRQGHVVGSHTVTHPNLAQVGRDEAAREMREARRTLEAKLGAPIRHFSYPSPILQPHWDAGTTASCADAGYRTAVTCTPGPVTATDSPLCLKRIAAPDDFRWAVQCAFLGRCV
jgi:peptidoglycan/xylan/chitin deacetylase (PgdA/CDA1 family)